MPPDAVDLTPDFRKVHIGASNAPSTSRESFVPLAPIEDYRKKAINLELESNFAWKNVIEDATNRLVKWYKWAGVEVDMKSIPEILLIPKSLSTDQKYGGFYDTTTNMTIVYIDPQDVSLTSISKIHHELHHSISKKFQVEKSFKSNDRLNYHHPYQFGLTSSNWNHTGERVDRGEMFEEGFVEFMAIEYAATSNNEAVVLAREKYLQKSDDQLGGADLTESEEVKSNRVRLLLKFQENIDELPTEKYLLAKDTIIKLLTDADSIKIKDFKYRLFGQIMRTRMFPTEKNKLINLIDKMYGRGVGRQFFLCQFEKDSILSLWKLMVLQPNR